MSSAVQMPPVVEGEVVGRLRRALTRLSREEPTLTVDASRVERLSPAGQATLVAAARLTRSRGGSLSISNPSPATVEALRSSGLLHLLAPVARGAIRLDGVGRTDAP